MALRILLPILLLSMLTPARPKAQYSLATQQILDHFTLDYWANPAIGLDKAALQQAVSEAQGKDQFKAQFLLAAYAIHYEGGSQALSELLNCKLTGKKFDVSKDTLCKLDYNLAEMLVKKGESDFAEVLFAEIISTTDKSNLVYWLSKNSKLRLFPDQAKMHAFEQEIREDAKIYLSQKDYERVALTFSFILKDKTARDYLEKNAALFENSTNPALRLKYASVAALKHVKFSNFNVLPPIIDLGKAAYSALTNKNIDNEIDYLELCTHEARLNNDYEEAHRIAIKSCIIANVDTSENFSIDANFVSENQNINLISNLATTHLYLGIDHVKKAFDIIERLAYLINKKANRLTDWNIASHYYSKKKIAVDRLLQIADYMWQEEKDISYLNRALAYLDTYKGAVIYDQLFQEIATRNDPNLHEVWKLDQILAKEEELLRNKPDSVGIFELLANVLTKRKRIKEGLLKTYPDYFEQKNKISTDFLGEQQAQLQKQNASILYYFYHPNFSYRVLINSDTVVFSRVHNPILHPNNLPELMASYPPCISRSPLAENLEGQECLADGYALSQLLLGENIKPLLKERVIITGNGIFDAFPFQALPLDSLGEHYFGLQHRITYAASLRLLSLMEEQIVKPQHTAILGFAPTFWGLDEGQFLAQQQRQLGGALTANSEELKNISELVKGRYLYGDEASKQQFFAQAANYSILHLATHAKADANDGRESVFLLADGQGEFEAIYAEDLRRLRLNTNLVSLSACETGLGSQHLTEGNIGFIHAFMAAGTKAIVASHWTVEDQSTAEIMQLFYSFLQENKNKDEALRLAQNAFRKRHAATYRDHPYYWAPFSFYGDAQPLDLDKPSNASLPLGLTLLGGLMLSFWYWQRRKRA